MIFYSLMAVKSSKKKLKKSDKSKSKHPEVTHHLCHQFNNLYGVLKVCFKEKALNTKEAHTWTTDTNQSELSYIACFKFNPASGAYDLGLLNLAFFSFA